MFSALLKKLDENFVTLIRQLEYIILDYGTDYSQYSEVGQNRVAMTMSVAGAVKKVLDTPILDTEGSITEESGATHTEITKYLENAQSVLA